jgi:NADPH:quinone reductase-like Zn-dependent oxidoreductase
VLGSESVGVIEAVGPGVDTLGVGQRVITVLVTGTWQELIVVAASQVVAIPDSLNDSTACQLTTNPLTALLLVREIEVQPGDWLLQPPRARPSASWWCSWRAIAASRRSTSSGAGPQRPRSAARWDRGHLHEDEDRAARVDEIGGSQGVRKALDCVAGQLGADVFRALAAEGSSSSTERLPPTARPTRQP